MRGKLIAIGVRPKSQRSRSRRTNLSADQVASTAQTFTSTSPSSNPTVRTMFSVRSLATPEVFFGQEIQSMPLDASLSRSPGNRFVRSALFRTKRIPKSRAPRDAGVTPSGNLPSVSRKSAGGFTNCVRAPGFIPSLATSGVPEYPTVLFGTVKRCPFVSGISGRACRK
jgi:hypothetical protein